MNTKYLQSESAAGALIPFNITDSPKLVDDEFFFLANRPGTPLLRKNAIYREGHNGKLKPVKYGKVRYRIISTDIVFNLFDIISVSDEYILIYKNGGMVVPFTNIEHC